MDGERELKLSFSTVLSYVTRIRSFHISKPIHDTSRDCRKAVSEMKTAGPFASFNFLQNSTKIVKSLRG